MENGRLDEAAEITRRLKEESEWDEKQPPATHYERWHPSALPAQASSRAADATLATNFRYSAVVCIIYDSCNVRRQSVSGRSLLCRCLCLLVSLQGTCNSRLQQSILCPLQMQ